MCTNPPGFPQLNNQLNIFVWFEGIKYVSIFRQLKK